MFLPNFLFCYFFFLLCLIPLFASAFLQGIVVPSYKLEVLGCSTVSLVHFVSSFSFLCILRNIILSCKPLTLANKSLSGSKNLHFLFSSSFFFKRCVCVCLVYLSLCVCFYKYTLHIRASCVCTTYRCGDSELRILRMKPSHRFSVAPCIPFCHRHCHFSVILQGG